MLTKRSRILLINPDKFGDMIVCLPAINAIRQTLPDADVTIFANRSNMALFEGTNLVDRLIDVPPEFSFAWCLRNLVFDRRRYDSAIFLVRSGARKWMRMCLLAGIPVRVASPSRHRFIDIAVNRLVKRPTPITETDLAIKLVEAAIGPLRERPGFMIAADLAGTQDLLRTENVADGFVSIHVSTVSSPSYPVERWAWIAGEIVARTGRDVVFTGVKGDPTPSTRIPGVHSLIGLTSFGQYTGVIARAALVVSASTSAVHIATAMGVPVVLVETMQKTPSHLVQYLPANVPLRHLVGSFGDGGFEMPSTEQVLDAVIDILEVGGRQSPFEDQLPPLDQRALPMKVCWPVEDPKLTSLGSTNGRATVT